MIDHDRLFKELLSTFFIDFLQLFDPEVIPYLDAESITFLDKEIFTDVTAGDRYETDLLVKARFRGKPSFFLIHVENQASAQAQFGKRMFRYFARLSEKFDLPTYPIVVFSYDQPKTQAPDQYQVSFPDLDVLTFNYRVIQLNQLNWRDFLSAQNPVASALMAKMQISPEDRPKVKAECLRLLVTLKLNPAKMQLISGFIDTYLNLTPAEETQFRIEINQQTPEEQADVMEIVTSWMQQGLEQGLEQGRKTGAANFALRYLTHQLGPLPEDLRHKVQDLSEQQIDQLADTLATLDSIDHLRRWLNDYS